MHVRVYLDSGPKVSHLVGSEFDAYRQDSKALCGREPWPERWHGEGNPAQHEEARLLPLCVSCKAVLVKRGGL